ncbi:MAG: hypothetical protein FWF95_05750 [Syntrophorhabdaceae bacterium]|nr:hypothetical protein [Syntrophorhabdaceae bacterium]
MRGNICFALIAFLVLGLAPGCATTDGNLKTEHQDASAITEPPNDTAESGKRKALSGGLLGALKDGFLGKYSYRKEKGLQETRQTHSENPEITSARVKIEAIRTTPSIADNGDTIEIRIKYAVLTPREDMTVLVRETRKILFEENQVGEATVSIEREGGTWRSSVPITLPQDVSPGTYRVVASVQTPDGEQDTEEVTFRVR